jgi:RHS repeat-associated protein
VTGLGGLPLEQIAGNTTSYYHQDRIGSTRSISNASGSVVSTYSYDAYGNVTSSTGSLVNPFRFAGQYMDSESGLQYDRARYYDPNFGGFVSRDPAAAATRQPYEYVANSPVNGSDPGGLGLLEGANALLGGGQDIAQNVPAALAYIGLGTIVNEHDKLVSGDPLQVTSAVLDILALASPMAVGLAGKVALIGTESAAAGGLGGAVRLGETVAPLARSYAAYDTYLTDVASHYGINLRGVTAVFDDSIGVGVKGLTRESEGGWTIRINPGFRDEGDLANTIAHELRHARAFQKGLSSPEGPAYASGDALQEWINGLR